MIDDLPRTRIPTFSKVCDAYDWFDPALDRVIREALRAEPFTNRRQWEFAMIYLALHEAGVLRRNAKGLGLGVGTEKLIFALAERVAEIRATDLYEPDSRWRGVRTSDPQVFVTARAPWPVPEGRIRAEYADMRHLPFADSSFDFAWSTGSFEHIGDDDDFLAHLNEVDRVLAPGGVYMLTTVLSYEAETSRIPHNYYFHPEHFIDLLHASALEPDPVYDMRITRHQLNRPMPETMRPYGLSGVEHHLHPVVAWRRGIVNVANIAFLRKGCGGPAQRPQIVGFAETCAWLQRQASAATKRLWAEWTPLAVHPREHKATTDWHFFGSKTVEIEIDGPATRGCAVATLLARDRLTPGDTRPSRRLDLGTGKLVFGFEASRAETYALDIAGVPGEELERLWVRARHSAGV